MQRETILALIGAVAALVLDIVISPSLMVFSATPNFIIAYAVVLSMVHRSNATFIIAFALGMLADLLGYGPVGCLAFLLVLVSFASSRVSAAFDDGALMTPMVLMAIFIAAVELLHAVVMLALTSGVSAIDAIVYLAIPCTMFDIVLGLILYPILSRIFVAKRPTMGSEPPTARLR